MFRKIRVPLILLIVAGMLGLGASAPPAEAQQPPAPDRPLLLIGGTTVGADFPTWPGNVEWLENEGGYTEGVDLFVGEMARQDTNPDWPSWIPLVPDWEDVVDDLESAGASTAGLAAMDDSTEAIFHQIASVLALTGAEEIDIIAHSQAPVIVRRAIRNFEEGEYLDANQQPLDNPVNTFVSLGGAHYGISTQNPVFIDAYGSLFSWFGMSLCRDNAYMPVCPDIVRHDGGQSPPVVPDPYNPDPTLYESSFFPDLNDLGGVGPVPGDTDYYHFYTTLFEECDPTCNYDVDGEAIPLFPQDGPTNVSVQNFCLFDSPPVQNYPLHHNDEWEDPVMRELTGAALGLWSADPSVCSE